MAYFRLKANHWRAFRAGFPLVAVRLLLREVVLEEV
jgi:hypothetical protein